MFGKDWTGMNKMGKRINLIENILISKSGTGKNKILKNWLRKELDIKGLHKKGLNIKGLHKNELYKKGSNENG